MPGRGSPRRPVAMALAVLALLAGCTVTFTRTGDGPPAASIKRGHAITVDFWHRPTRAEIGIPDGRNFVAYDRPGPMFVTTLTFPRGSFTMPSFEFNAASDDGGGALDPVPHEPKVFDILRRFTSGAEVRAAMIAEAGPLGLRRDEIDRTGDGVLHGFVDGWLSVDVIISGDAADDTLQADYQVSIDRYHNPAVDRIVRDDPAGDGAVLIDLTRRPTRADVGLLDSYTEAFLQPTWQRSLAATFVLPRGRLVHDVTSVASTSQITTGQDPRGTGPPLDTIVNLADSSLPATRTDLLRDASTLGISPTAVRAAYAGPAGTRAVISLDGRASAVCTIVVRIDLTPGQVGNYAANVSYRFTYR